MTHIVFEQMGFNFVESSCPCPEAQAGFNFLIQQQSIFVAGQNNKQLFLCHIYSDTFNWDNKKYDKYE